MRWLIVGLVAVLLTCGLPTSADRRAEVRAREAKPDVRKAKALPRWPSAKDLARLKSVEGKPSWKVIQVLGHPSKVERRKDGTQVWKYPWVASCSVWIEKGRCTGTWYEGGY
jgi:hypothetical protein